MVEKFLTMCIIVSLVLLAFAAVGYTLSLVKTAWGW